MEIHAIFFPYHGFMHEVSCLYGVSAPQSPPHLFKAWFLAAVTCKDFIFLIAARYMRTVWRKARKAKKENSEGTWPLWVEGVVKTLFETMQPSSTDDLAKSWGLPDPHL